MRWIEHLPWVLLGIRAAPKEDSGVSGAEAVFGGQLVLPGQFLNPAGAGSLQLSKAAQENGVGIPLLVRTYAEAAGGLPSLLEGVDYVYVPRVPLLVRFRPLMMAHIGWWPEMRNGSGCSWGRRWILSLLTG